MARMSLYGSLTPDTTGNAFPEPLTVKATNDLSLQVVWMLADSGADVALHFAFSVPSDYGSAPKLVAQVASLATSGNFVLEGSVRTVANAETLDPTTWQETITGSATAVSGTALNRLEHSLTFTAATFAAHDFVLGKLIRKGSSGSDTLAADLALVEFEFEYTPA